MTAPGMLDVVRLTQFEKTGPWFDGARRGPAENVYPGTIGTVVFLSRGWACIEVMPSTAWEDGGQPRLVDVPLDRLELVSKCGAE